MKKGIEKAGIQKNSENSAGRDSGPSRPGAVTKGGSSEDRVKVQRSNQAKGSSLSQKVKSMGEWFSIATMFLKESRSELKKVKWPTKKELLASTAVVIVLVLIVSLYLGIVDFGLIKLVKGVVG